MSAEIQMQTNPEALRRKMALDDAIRNAWQCASALAAAALGEHDRSVGSALSLGHSTACDLARELEQVRRSR